MNKFRYTTNTIINTIINKRPYNKNKNKFEAACTKIYILKSNIDDDEQIINSLKNQLCDMRDNTTYIRKPICTKCQYNNCICSYKELKE